MKKIILLLLACFLFACDQNADDVYKTRVERNLIEREGLYYAPFETIPYTGQRVRYRPSGVKDVTSFVKGEQEGLRTLWYENGQQIMERRYHDGELYGVFIDWWENGQKAREGMITDGQFDGVTLNWHNNGQLAKKGIYRLGIKEGLWAEWWENGKQLSVVIYKDGVWHGQNQLWDQNGLMIEDRCYQNGELVPSVAGSLCQD